ncbi:MAG: hypothetical protein IKX23_02100 [Treponema sp.]|nr:hypothetical protein [Treponema sp.]
MATSTNLSSIIKFYSDKQKSPFIDLREFCAFIKKYAEKHVEEEAGLVKYLGDPTNTVTAELAGLETKHLAAVIPNGSTKKTIVCISHFTFSFAERYKELIKNESVPYPIETDLPKRFPTQVLEKKQAENYITQCLEKQDTKSPLLYLMAFSRDIPALVLPACVPIQLLIESAQQKIRKIVRKSEYHDYFLKKLRSSNPSKEITIKNFYGVFIDKENSGFIQVDDGDDYYLWNQLCYYLRLDFEKIQDRTIEDTNILQAIEISEIFSTYLKQKFQTSKKRTEALNELKRQLGESPYFFSMNQILKFHDKNGRLLYGQYSEDDLKNCLQTLSTDTGGNGLPELVVFKVASGTRYYVYKKKVIPLVVRLCNEAHDAIESVLVKKWNNVLLDFRKLPEMTDAAKFEKILEAQVEEHSPVLFALLNANFMTLFALNNSVDFESSFSLFDDGILKSYSELLLLTNSQVLSKAKMDLPFVYTFPLISWIIGLFKSNKKKKKVKPVEEAPVVQEEETVKTEKHYSKEEALSKAAKELADDFIPEGSTLDRELNYLNKQWNKMITKEANMTLTEDVNSLIRDYTRRVVKTLSAVSFTKERVQNLAETLVKTPNMQKIGEQKALTEYVELYILRLVSNFQRKS